MKRYLTLLLLLGFWGCTPSINPCEDYIGPPAVTIATWGAPLEPVDYYIVELSTNGREYIQVATTEEESYRFYDEIEFCNSYKCRVIAVGGGGQSDPSPPSIRYAPIPDVEIYEEKK